MNPNNITFNSHKNHNPHCDIVCYQLDKDTTITYGVYVKPYINKSGRGSYVGQGQYQISAGTEFMEIYVGENYNVGSTKRSYSRCYYDKDNKFPKAHTILWFKLRDWYTNNKTIELVVSKFNY
jgi:hypothetical protein